MPEKPKYDLLWKDDHYVLVIRMDFVIDLDKTPDTTVSAMMPCGLISLTVEESQKVVDIIENAINKDKK